MTGLCLSWVQAGGPQLPDWTGIRTAGITGKISFGYRYERNPVFGDNNIFFSIMSSLPQGWRLGLTRGSRTPKAKSSPCGKHRRCSHHTPPRTHPPSGSVMNKIFLIAPMIRTSTGSTRIFTKVCAFHSLIEDNEGQKECTRTLSSLQTSAAFGKKEDKDRKSIFSQAAIFLASWTDFDPDDITPEKTAEFINVKSICKVNNITSSFHPSRVAE